MAGLDRLLIARGVSALLLALLASAAFARGAPAVEPDPSSADPVARGAYVLRAAGCATCHTDVANGGAFLAGGRMLSSPWGAIAVPNITPDPETGIGGWSEEDFVRALRDGKSPAGRTYYPAFPYTAYSGMRREDMLDLKAYLDTVAPVVGPPTSGTGCGFRSTCVSRSIPGAGSSSSVSLRSTVPARTSAWRAAAISSKRWATARNATRRATCWAR